MVLGAEVYPEIPGNWSKAVPEANDSIPQHEIRPNPPTLLADIYRLFEERFDGQLNVMKIHFDQQDEPYGEDKRDKTAFSRP